MSVIASYAVIAMTMMVFFSAENRLFHVILRRSHNLKGLYWYWRQVEVVMRMEMGYLRTEVGSFE